MRRSALGSLLLLLTACVSPGGVPVEECNTSWRGLAAQIATGADRDRLPIQIACIWPVGEERISIGFEMPSGPDCFELAAIDLEESADAVAVTLFVAPASDVGGACPTEPLRVVTEVDLQAPVGDRAMLDGSR
jgi:hypothetical protein